MSEQSGDAVYTAPPAAWETTEAHRAGYLAAHEAGWQHAKRAATHPDSADTGERVTDVAQRWATDQGYTPHSRAWLRAHSGFVNGAAAFAGTDNDD